MLKARRRIFFGVFLLILQAYACAYALQVVNNTASELHDVILTAPGYREDFGTIQANNSTGHIFRLREIPQEARLTWREQGAEESFQLIFEVSQLLPEELQPQLTEIVFVITGQGAGHVEFNLNAGSFSIERYIPDEYPNAKRARLATEELAQLARSGAEQGFAELIAEGARLNPISILDPVPLQQAILSGNPNTVDILLDLGAQTEHRERGYAALIQASHVGQLEMVRLLIRKGADVNVVAVNDSALIAAAGKGLLEITRLLIDNGADPNLKAMQEFPLISAIRQGHLESVEFLLQSGADPTQSFVGNNLETFARNFGRHDIADLLSSWIAEHGVRVQVPTKAQALSSYWRNLGYEPVLLQAGHERLNEEYTSPDLSFRLRFPELIGSEIEVVERSDMQSDTKEARFFSDTGVTGALVVSALKRGRGDSNDSANEILTGIKENLATVNLPVEHVWRSAGQRTILDYSLPNERYDDVGFPYGFVLDKTQSDITTIGVGAYFVAGQRLFQVALIIPLETEMDVRAARDLGYESLHTLVDAVSFNR